MSAADLKEKKHVLVVEDNVDVRNEISTILELESFQVSIAENGKRALEILENIEPDIIISDIMMPEMNGIEFLENIRKTKRTQDIPFLFLSARSSRKDLREGMNLGAEDYITKPFAIEELIQSINARIQRFDELRSIHSEILQNNASGFDGLEQLKKNLLKNKEFLENKFYVAMLRVDRNELIHSFLGWSGYQKLTDALLERISQFVAGDEFVSTNSNGLFVLALRKEEEGEEAANYRLSSIFSEFTEPFIINGERFHITLSAGIDLNPGTGSEENIYDRAEKALLESFYKGGNRIFYYNQNVVDSITSQRNLEIALDVAIKNKEIRVHYQPQYNFKEDKVLGFEALVRWNHEGKDIPPGLFIEIAEKNGAIIPLGELIFEQVMQDIRANPGIFAEARVAVNFSPHQLNQTDCVTKFKNIISKYKVSPDRIEIEITESALINKEIANKNIKEFYDMGIGIALDDFGTGYSTFVYLKDSHVTKLKIDRSFINNIKKNVHEPIIPALINLSHEMKLKVVAEGVETDLQYQTLKNWGCDTIQGYFISKPVPLETILKGVEPSSGADHGTE